MLTAPASGQSVVVVVADAPTRAEIRAAVIETIAERGVRLVRTPDGEVCDDDPIECAAELAALTGADATLRIDAEVGDTSRVRVRLVPAEGDAIEASEDVLEADFASAAAAAVATVLSQQRELAGFVLVRSDPPGARVEIDGDDVGHTPLRHTLSPGEHVVRLVHDRGTHEETVTVVASQEVSVEPDLARNGAGGETGAPPEPLTRSEASPLNWIIGAGLAVASVGTLISPLSTLARGGECVDEIEGVGCVEQVRFGVQSGVLLGVGITGLLAAVIVDALAPIRVDVMVGRRGAGATVAGSF